MLIGLILGLVAGGAAAAAFLKRRVILFGLRRGPMFQGGLLGVDVPPPTPWWLRTGPWGSTRLLYVVDSTGREVLATAVPAATARRIVEAVNRPAA